MEILSIPNHNFWIVLYKNFFYEKKMTFKLYNLERLPKKKTLNQRDKIRIFIFIKCRKKIRGRGKKYSYLL